MRVSLKSAAFASVFVLGAFIGSPAVLAQDSDGQPCVGETCPPKSQQMEDVPDQGTMKRKKGAGQGEQIQGTDESSDQVIPRKRKRQNTQSTDVDVDVDVNVGSRKSVRHVDWRFDPGRHQRRRSKSATFRFYYGGWWYPRPYWEVYVVPGRISCGEGRAIVASRFNRVRVVECRGRIYTYLGRRHGDTWRVLVNSRNGRIVGRAVI